MTSGYSYHLTSFDHHIQLQQGLQNTLLGHKLIQDAGGGCQERMRGLLQ